MMGSNSKYIKFADPEVERICIANFSSDGKGVTYEDAAAVTDSQFGTIFKGNRTIVAFDELQFFTKLSLLNESFSNCSSLRKVTIPSNILGDFYAAFMNDIALADVRFLGTAFSSHYATFYGVSRPLNIHLNSGDYSLLANIFNANINQDSVRIFVNGLLVRDFVIPEGVTEISEWTYFNFNYGVKITVPVSVVSIGSNALFARDSTLVFLGNIPPTITDKYNIGGAFTKKYVPYSVDHSVLNAFQTAPHWNDVPDSIFELNPDGSIPND